MKIGLMDAARLLGKTPRQLRYMMKTGRLKGEKDGGRWVFDEASLPVSPQRARAREQKAAEVAAAVDEALGPHLRPAGRRAYSVVDLAAFRAGVERCREACAAQGASIAADALRASVVALAQGCHRFHQREKADAFRLAREHAAAAVAHLHIDGNAASKAIADAIEHEYLLALVGLLRRQERRERA